MAQINQKNGLLQSDELASFCLQLSMLLRAGVTPAEALASMRTQSGEGEEAVLLSAALQGLEGGAPLSEALRTAGRFPHYLTDMLAVGEMTGHTEQVTRALAAHYEREAALASAIRRAVLYPGAMALILVVVVFALLTQVMPVFETVYRELGSEMSGVARLLLRAGDAMRPATAVLAVLIAAVSAAALLALLTPMGQPIAARVSRWMQKTQLSCALARARYASVMSLMLSSGFGMGEGAESAVALVGNETIRTAADACAASVAEGMDFPGAAEQAGLFTGVHAALLRAGFRAGQPDGAMEEVARMCRDDAEARLDRMVGRVEPMLVSALSVLVGAVLLSAMLPLLSVLAAR